SGIEQRNRCAEREGYKPPAPPKRRQDCKTDRRVGRAEEAVAIHGSHHEPVAARREVSVVDRSLVGQGTPIFVCPLQPVLVTQHFAKREMQAGKFDAQIILTRSQGKAGKHALTQIGNRECLSLDGNAADEWRLRWPRRFGLRYAAGESVGGSKP